MLDAVKLYEENNALKAQLHNQQQQLQAIKTSVVETKTELDHSQLQLKNKGIYIAQLEELIKQFKRKQYSYSSEKISLDQLGLFNEAEVQLKEEQDAQAAIWKKPAKHNKPRISIPADYPREIITHDLAQADKVCPHDGSALTLIGHEAHEQLEIIPAQVKVLQHQRLKYACDCCKQYVVTADKPKQPIEKSIVSPNLLAYVATQKYADALPLYRQATIFKRLGIELNRTNLANWLVKGGELTQPLINLLQEQALNAPVVHMDETTLQVLNEPGKTPQSKSYLWLTACFGERPITVFHYAPTRSQAIPQNLLNEQVKALMVDGYAGYQSACDDYDITRLGCWAHARRKFVEAQQVQGKAGHAADAIALIGQLYRIEKKIKDKPPDERHAIRQRQARPIIDKLRVWLQTTQPQIPPQSALGKALHYLQHQWPRLIQYLENGAYPIDNNLAENAIRPFTVGRKNWLFANSQAGANASANLYSLIETAKANNLNPHSYLQQVFTHLPNAKTLEDVEQLLPWNISLD